MRSFKAEVKQIFENLDSLLESIDYTEASGSFAFFVNAHVKEMYRLPFQVENRVVIDSTFVTRDIVKVLNRIPRYWVLVLGKKPTRLFHGVGDTLTEIVEPATDLYGNDKDGFPFNYIPPNVESEHKLMGDHLHRDARHLDDCRKEFFRKIDDLLDRFISIENLPLALVGNKQNCVIFRNVSKIKNILCVIHGDYETASSNDISRGAWPSVKDYLEKVREKKIGEFQEAIGRMHHAFGIDTVWRVAKEGKVNELLVEEGFSVPGIVNPENDKDVIIYEKSDSPSISDDLINSLIEMVEEKGGKVIFCKPDTLKEYDRVAAILRY